jgi:hypothetical protein
VDTTGSVGEEIAAIQSSIDSVIVPEVGEVIGDAAFGVGRFEDFPVDPYGLPSDIPVALLQPITSDLAEIQAGVDALPPAAGGLDTPESGMEALYQWASGVGIPEAGLDPFSPGDIGGAGFRRNSLPIILQITDARSHTPADYEPMSLTTRGRDDTVAALQAIGARVIGIRSTENADTADDPREELEDLARATGAVIPPQDGACATGIEGASRDPVEHGGQDVCPLVFDVRPDGTGLGEIIVDAIEQLASLSDLDISARAVGKLEGEGRSGVHREQAVDRDVHGDADQLRHRRGRPRKPGHLPACRLQLPDQQQRDRGLSGSRPRRGRRDADLHRRRRGARGRRLHRADLRRGRHGRRQRRCASLPARRAFHGPLQGREGQ